MRTAARAAAVVALVVAAVPVTRAEAAPSPLRWRLWRLSREGTAARPLKTMVILTPASSETLAFVVGLSGSGTKRTVVQSAFLDRGAAWPAVYHGGQTNSTCVAAVGCDVAGEPYYLPAGSSSTRPVTHDYFVLTWAADARLARGTTGWRLREAPAPKVSRATGRDSGSGVYADAATIERFTGASAQGGRAGSVAWASLACGTGGYGSGSLTAQPAAPGAAVAMACGRDTHGSAVVGRAVRWRFAADAVGAGSGDTRLLVFDLPK